MKPSLINYFHFSRNERLGVIALIIITALVFATPNVLQWIRPEQKTDFSAFEAVIRAYRKSASVVAANTAENFDFDPNLATAEDFQRMGLSAKVSNNICRFREKGGKFREPEDFKKIWNLEPADYARLLPYIRIGSGKAQFSSTAFSPEKPESFPFDPNTVSELDMQRLGLSKYCIKSILNYREKGGVFRKKEDFARIYSLSKQDYERLAPFINISSTVPGGKTTAIIDMNTATVETWKSLPMIGEARAQQIVKFRTRLGGFQSVEQLAELYNFPDSVYQRIRPQLSLGTPVLQKINLNTATLDQLLAHPYISRKQAELICAYRDQHGAYTSVEAVLNIKAFTDMNWWRRISPYLTVE